MKAGEAHGVVSVAAQHLRQVAQKSGRYEVYPGWLVATSVITPAPTVWRLRPMSKDAQVGEHIAVVWNRV